MTTPQSESSQSKTADRADVLLDEFESEWEAHRPPSVHHFLDRGVPPDRRIAFLKELIILDAAYRRRRGESAALAEYLKFPEFASLPTGEHAEVEQAIGRCVPCGDPPRYESIGKYRVLKHLGDGGQAAAYLVFHPELNRNVVVKIWLKPINADSPEYRRPSNEGQILARLEHENLVRVHDADTHHGRPFLVLEHIDGQSLGVTPRPPVPPEEAIRIAAGVAAGLGAAHAKGVFHRDVNPNNILLDADGRPRLIDFGMADRRGWLDPSDTSRPGGTLAYLAPEQARALSGDATAPAPTAATDVFGVGGVLYYLLTGHPPYARDSQKAMLAQASRRDIDLSGLDFPPIPKALRAVCLKALAAAPAERYANGAELAEALRRLISKRVNHFRRVMATVALTFLIAATGGLIYGLKQTESPTGVPILQVRLSRLGQADQPVSKVLPIQAGDAVQLTAKIPRNLHVGVYLVNGAGELQHIADYPAGDADREEVYPGPGKTSELAGPAGTEFLFACGRPDRLPTLEEVQQAWAAEKGWEPLPLALALLVKPDGAEWEGERPRDLGVVREQQQPAEIVRRRIEAFRNQLQKAGIHSMSGVAFSHQ